MPGSRQRTGDGPVSHSKTVPLNFLGMQVSGDFGPFTVYRDRYRRIQLFYYSPPTKPPTPAQLAHRARFVAAQAAWSALTDDEKYNLEEACRRTSLCLTGQNLYISATLKRKTDQYNIVGKQANLQLPPLPSFNDE